MLTANLRTGFVPEITKENIIKSEFMYALVTLSVDKGKYPTLIWRKLIQVELWEDFEVVLKAFP